MSVFEQTLQRYGADAGSLRMFADGGADLLPYATLLSARHSEEDLAALAGVVEWQENPLAFLVDGEALRDDAHLQSIRRRVAMRGDAPYLGVVTAGRLAIYRIGLDSARPTDTQIKLDLPAAEMHSTFANLANNRPGLEATKRWISEVVLKLLNDSISALITQANLSHEDAISLVGRALFTRFLGDRGLLPRELARGAAAAEALFDTASSIEAVSTWLDVTFNGDLLPIAVSAIRRLPLSARSILGNMLRRAPDGQRYLDWREDWAHLDFAHIPVGVLSQAYEHYQKKFSPKKQHHEGSYYTPRVIAQVMVRGAFHALRAEDRAHTAHVLDPAVGGGVFLIAAFRQLVMERWRNDGVQPDTKVLRRILGRQIVGFDINEAALRFAALGLYLISIELDPNPRPVQKLRFKNLRGKVLLKVDHRDGLGSLGEGVDHSHLSRYDLVIGNPPWSSSTQLTNWNKVKAKVNAVFASRNAPADRVPLLPNEVVDLPFVWSAMQWAKPSAHIVFALHARLLFQQGEGMSEARAALFAALNVTGIVNGSELRMTKVWPEVSAPFCLLFARNELPLPSSGFKFVSPRVEVALNASGNLRIDAGNASVVTSEQVVARPELLKVLFRGGPLDLEILDRIECQKLTSLAEIWAIPDDAKASEIVRFSGNGYQKLRPSSRIRKVGDGRPGVDAAYLLGLPELDGGQEWSIVVGPANLRRFSEERIHDPRPRGLFRGPLLIVHKSPRVDSGRIGVAVADRDIVFNESFYGYSTQWHPDGKQLAQYLAVVLGSSTAIWYALMTSGEFGFEREVVEKFAIERMPLPAFDTLTKEMRSQIEGIFLRIASGGREGWHKADKWVAKLYGLTEVDVEVMAETLRNNLPYARNREAAQLPPTESQRKLFCSRLEAELQPWASRLNKSKSLHVSPIPRTGTPPWELFSVSTKIKGATGNMDWEPVLRLADRLACTEAIDVDLGSGTLRIARLAQARYWTQTEAQLLARHIVWNYLDKVVAGARS